jgi:L-alanine-DL-glutamate epimerase-like enolase superfamily enzyme
MINKRDFLTLGASGLILSAAGCAHSKPQSSPEAPDPSELRAKLREAAARPVLRTDRITQPVVLTSLDVMTRDGEYFIRAEDKDGAVGWALTNNQRFPAAAKIFQQRVAPALIGKDMRDYERHLADAFGFESNYKWQGLALWICFARAELAILDLIGKKVGEPINRLLGDPVRDSIGIYHANGNRDRPAQHVVESLRKAIDESGAKAVKFKVGGRLRTTEASDARDRELIPLMRESFGPDMVIYADSNSSYSVEQAILFGRMMEEAGFGFFEEPVRWDDLDGTRRVADALSIPIAGGEQESSIYNFEWQIVNRALQVVQPDLIYFGGLVRSLRVARMAEVAGLPCVPHISGRGLGSVSVAHFASLVPNTTDYQEYKGDPDDVPYEMTDGGGRYDVRNGRYAIPKAPGFGVTFDPDYLSRLTLLEG